METWRLLLGLAGMLVVYALLGTLLGFRMTPFDFVMAVIFGAIGIYVGQVLSDRMNSDGE